MVIEHRVAQTINLVLPGTRFERTRFEKKLRTMVNAVNLELASQGLIVIDIAYGPGKNEYHYSVPSSYSKKDYLLIKKAVKKYCC